MQKVGGFFFVVTSCLFACGARSGLDDGASQRPTTNPPVEPSSIDTARPLSPLSTSTTATRTPTLRWELPKSADGAEVELCADRACAHSLAKVQVAGDHMQLSSIGRHVVYWRLRGTRAGVVGNATSATWELFTSARDAHDSAWGSVPDFNGDGLADWTLGAFGANDESGKAEVFYGRSDAVAQSPDVTLEGDARSYFGGVLGSIGDIDGDGFPELAVGSATGISIFAGGPSGIDAAKAPRTFDDGGPNAVGSAGDIDGDGYGDFFVAPQGAAIVLHFGGPKGSTRSKWIAPPIDNAFTYVASGDVDGDGHPDVCAGFVSLDNDARVELYMNGATQTIELPVEKLDVELLAAVDCRGDVDGDGFADVVVAYVTANGDVVDVFRGGPSGVSMTPSQVTFALEYGATDSSKGPPIALGDFDGDGRDDLVAGLLGRRLQIVPGSAHGLDASNMRTLALPGGVSDDPLVFAAIAPNIANGGDVNGDGVVDLVAGAQGYWLGDPPNQQIADLGHAWIYAGTPGGLTAASTPLITLAGPGNDELTFGCDVE